MLVRIQLTPLCSDSDPAGGSEHTTGLSISVSVTTVVGDRTVEKHDEHIFNMVDRKSNQKISNNENPLIDADSMDGRDKRDGKCRLL